MNVMGVYEPGSSWVHRAPVGPKLLTMFVISTVAVFFRSWQAAVALLALDALLVVVSGISWRKAFPTMWGLWLSMALLAGYQVWQNGPERAVVVVGSLLGLIALASIFTATTSADDLLATLLRVIRPLRVLGVNPELVALAFSLLIRGIPTSMELARETRQAALARGLDRNLRAHLIPWVIRVVAHARATGDALHARGVGD